MKALSATHTADLAGFWLALGSYALFLCLAIVTRAGKGRAPQSRFNRLHLRTTAVYGVACAAWCLCGGGGVQVRELADFVIGLFVYFGCHYAIVGPAFGLAQASVSTSILSIIYACGGRATPQQCDASYASGQGFAYIKQSRMSRLQQALGWVRVQDGKYHLTKSGAAMARLTRLILTVWGLQQMGRKL
jgi:hypothetical protein